jgi:ribose/xylose/arabinose/galactoside ABC-type transport system permease subunit
MNRLLITLGLILLAVGILWPWLDKLGLGRLPGDIVIEKEHSRFFFPITTSLLISIILSILFWIFRK